MISKLINSFCTSICFLFIVSFLDTEVRVGESWYRREMKGERMRGEDLTLSEIRIKFFKPKLIYDFIISLIVRFVL